MPRKRTLLSALVFALSSMPAFASLASDELPEPVRYYGTKFQLNESALRTYVMLERYVKGSCPADVSPEDLLEAVKLIGSKAYAPIREKATQKEVDTLRTCLENAYRQSDPDIIEAVQHVVFTQDDFAKKHLAERDRAPHCLGFAWRTIMLFTSQNVDCDLLPGEGIMGRRFFAQGLVGGREGFERE